jgi:hypothetical protein
MGSVLLTTTRILILLTTTVQVAAAPVYHSNRRDEIRTTQRSDIAHSFATGYSQGSALDETLNSISPLRTGWVAFGDSYSAGLGAGAVADESENDSDGCRRRQGSFPWVLSQSEWLKEDTNGMVISYRDS